MTSVLSKILLLILIIQNVIKLKAQPLDNEISLILGGYHTNTLVNFAETNGTNDFISEEHTVITEDGYIHTIFRIRRQKCGQIKRTPIILMHGLLQSSDAWLDAGPNGLAYLLADACYDTWVGNQRGNFYSRKHVKLNPDRDPKFWQFSVDEIGFYDIPATIDYVLNNTGVEKLNYIGYSQGSGTFFIMCSERPGYCDKVNVLIALAPATRHTNSKSVAFRALCESVTKFERFLTLSGVHEILPKGGLSQELLAYLCNFTGATGAICGNIISLIDGFHPGSINVETVQNITNHLPAGTSTHNLARYGQSMQTENFQKFDYGRGKNLEIYGIEKPPVFNLTAVSIPVVVLYGRNDYIVDIEDIFWLLKKLPNVLESYEVADPLWNHFDMTYSQHTKNMLFPKVNQYLQKYSDC